MYIIPTAAITNEQKKFIPLCKDDLLNAGVLENNIITYNFDRIMPQNEIVAYDAIYVCGGSPQYLLDKMNENNFKQNLSCFLDSGGVYIGVSAGSIVLAKNLKKNLDYLNCILNVHMKDGSKSGKLECEELKTINLTDDQAIIINDTEVLIYE